MELSLEMLRNEGWQCQKVEHWNAFARRRQDLFGFIDILCMSESHCCFLAVNAMQSQEINNHVAKLRKSIMATIFLACGGRIHLHGWKKAGKRHPEAGKWICRIVKYPTNEP